jgi:type II secretory pathway pseudopilin PulG
VARAGARAGGARRAAAIVVIGPGIHRIPAQRLARRELARSIYQPSFLARLDNDLFGWLNRLSIGPQKSGWWLLIVLIIVVVLVIAGVLYWIGPMGRSRRQRSGAVLAGTQLSAADYRREAERLADGGDYAGAIIQRMRAIAVELETRGVLLPRPGRTASELAAEAGGSLPGSAAGLHAAARLFDDVRYGDRAGTPAGYEQVRDLDESIRAARTPAVSAVGASIPGPADGTGLIT